MKFIVLGGKSSPRPTPQQSWHLSCGVWREHAGLLSRPCRKEGPHLAMSGESRGFSGAAVPVWGFSQGTTGSPGSLSCGVREVKSPYEWRGGARHCSLVMVVESGLNAMKKDARGLSRVAAGNPGFPRLVPVTSGSFSGCL